MSRIRLKWLPLVLLLSPLAYLAGSSGMDWCLEPKPRYVLNFSPQDNVHSVLLKGSYLELRSGADRINYYGLRCLSDGKHIHTYAYQQIDDGLRYSERVRTGVTKEHMDGLNAKSYRYDMYREGDYFLDDNETGSHYRFIRCPKGFNYHCTLNETGTHCLVQMNNREANVRLMLGAFFGSGAFSYASNVLSLIQHRPSTSMAWHRPDFFSIITVPDGKVIAENIVSPFKATKQVGRFLMELLGLSPSGRWLVVGHNSEHSTNRDTEKPWTTLFVYDSAKHQWLSTSTTLNGLYHSVHFVSDDLIVLNDAGTMEGMEVHLPTGKIIAVQGIEQIGSGTYQDGVLTIRTHYNETGSGEKCLITTSQIDADGNTTTLHETAFSSRVGAVPCSGSQLFCYEYSWQFPTWIETRLPKGRLHDFVVDWYQRENHFIYDCTHEQVVMKWPGKWYGFVSKDGKTLVMNQTNQDRNTLKAVIYDLPLPVYSPWRGRTAGAAMLILLGLLLVRRRPQNITKNAAIIV